MDYAELYAAILGRISGGPSALSPRRLEHSRNVAQLAAQLCGSRGIDPERGRAAGIAHDMCKELPKDELRALAAAYPGAASSSLLGDKVAHGPAAALVLSRDYGVEEGEFLAAIAYHTLGRPGMGEFEAIVYCADKLEPGRKGVDPGFRAGCLALPPELMLPAVIARSVLWLESQGLPVAPETLELRDSLSRKVPIA